MEQVLEFLMEQLKKYSPLIIFGAAGAVVHRIRTKSKMTFKQFVGSLVVSIFVALSVGIVCRDYFNLSQSVICVLCGISGTFSKLILDELEETLGDLSEFIRKKLGLKPKDNPPKE